MATELTPKSNTAIIELRGVVAELAGLLKRVKSAPQDEKDAYSEYLAKKYS